VGARRRLSRPRCLTPRDFGDVRPTLAGLKKKAQAWEQEQTEGTEDSADLEIRTSRRSLGKDGNA